MNGTATNHAQKIGEKLQEARKRQGMSLRELARKAEISASMLSQIETGKAYPSVRSIYGIAAALSVPVDYFFPAPGNGSGAASPLPETAAEMALTASDVRAVVSNPGSGKAVRPFPEQPAGPLAVVHAAARPTIELKGGVTWSRLTALAEPDAEFLEVCYEAGASSGAEMSHHEGREFGLVLEGILVVELGFETHRMQAGDSIIFDSATPHRLVNPGPGPVQAIWVVFYQR